MNRLWVRFSLAFILVVLIVAVLPATLIVLLDDESLFQIVKSDIIATGIDASLGLSESQVNRLVLVLVAETRRDYTDNIQFITAAAIIVGSIAGVWFSRGLSAPIERLAQATQNVASRNLSHRVQVKGSQEITELATNFNQMTAALEQSESLRRHMMADVSHELLTPLTVLEGNLRAILDGVYDLTAEEIGALYEQSQHLIHLVKELRQLAQAEAGKLAFHFTEVDVEQLAQEVISIFSPLAAEQHITLQSTFDGQLPPIQADKARLRQVLHNLLANALRHTPEGGWIKLSTTHNAKEVYLSIQDNGAGIEPSLLPYIFDRFYQTEQTKRRDSGGAGLGLAIVKAIVEAHHGRITAYSSDKGPGSTFTLHLPQKQPTQHPPL